MRTVIGLKYGVVMMFDEECFELCVTNFTPETLIISLQWSVLGVNYGRTIKVEPGREWRKRYPDIHLAADDKGPLKLYAPMGFGDGNAFIDFFQASFSYKM